MFITYSVCAFIQPTSATTYNKHQQTSQLLVNKCNLSHRSSIKANRLDAAWMPQSTSVSGMKQWSHTGWSACIFVSSEQFIQYGKYNLIAQTSLHSSSFPFWDMSKQTRCASGSAQLSQLSTLRLVLCQLCPLWPAKCCLNYWNFRCSRQIWTQESSTLN